jgi:hypothetical protein
MVVGLLPSPCMGVSSLHLAPLAAAGRGLFPSCAAIASFPDPRPACLCRIAVSASAAATPRERQTPEALGVQQQAEIEKWAPHRADWLRSALAQVERSLSEAPAVVGRRFSSDFAEGGRE